jgi:mannose-6-phosphate isomerase-like protein (cupin superfamily)
MYTLHYSKSKKFDLPGRTVYSMVGHHGIKSDQMAFGIAELPAQSKMDPHKHIDEEEIIFIYEGFGKLHVGDDITEDLEPGTVIVAPRGVDHTIENMSQDVMRWAWVFNPPVKIGSHAQPRE